MVGEISNDMISIAVFMTLSDTVCAARSTAVYHCSRCPAAAKTKPNTCSPRLLPFAALPLWEVAVAPPVGAVKVALLVVAVPSAGFENEVIVNPALRQQPLEQQ